MFRANLAAISKHAAVLQTVGSDARPGVGPGTEVGRPHVECVGDFVLSSLCLASSIANKIANTTQIKRSIPHEISKTISNLFRPLRKVIFP